MEEGPKARRVLILLIASEAIAVVALHRLGDVDGFAIPRHDFGRWLQQSTSEEALLAGVRLVTLVAAWWLLGSTLLYVAARAARLHAAARALGWATLPVVRRWVDRAAAVSIVAATALGVGRPAADPPPTTSPASAPVVVDVDHRDPASVPSRPPSGVRTGQVVDSRPAPTVPPTGTTSPPPTTAPLVPPTAPPPVVPVMPPAPAAPSAAPAAGTTHTVTRGEHLWSIAAARVSSATGKPPTDVSPAEIAPYWLRVVELNRHRLRSGNPNLVYSGEVVELPPP